MTKLLTKYLFIDRDGTLIEEPEDFQIDSIEKFKLLPGVIPALLALQQAGYRLVMVSNQDGLGTENYPYSKFEMVQTLLLGILTSQGIQFEDVRICPHTASQNCFCRKPNLGLVRDFEFDGTRSYVIGDRLTDLTLAENMGIPGLRITKDLGWNEITQKLLCVPRIGFYERKTKETQIQVKVDLDNSNLRTISTGIDFFNHMLEQLSFHGGFGLVIQAKGDLAVDDHHTVEDTGIALGQALRIALGDKIGIERFGFYLPMDDASAQVTVDLSGRSYLKFDGKFNRESISGLATEMIPHFFRSFAEGLGANLHITLIGDNTHHQIESAFKAVGRSLRSAISLTATSSLAQAPSTKGIL